VRVAADIGDMTGGGVSVSPSGTIAYRPNVDFSRSQLTWFDRTGRALGTVGPAEVQGEPRVSPDATGVLTTRPQAIFLFDGRRLDRITVGRSGWPSWMPDGRRVVYSNGTSGRMDLWVKSIDETGDGVPFASSNQNKVLTSWTPDGGTALVDSLDPQDGMDLLVIDAAGDRRLRPWLKTRSVERGAQFSPDGISPRWSPDGGEIYFIAPDGSMMAVPVKGQGNTLTVGPAERLFKVAIKGGGTAANIASNYDVARDGRFLVNVVNDDPTPIVIIQNWRPPEPSAPAP
jgi:Tol biopolymer transport system component